jgi:hypothetical protein
MIMINMSNEEKKAHMSIIPKEQVTTYTKEEIQTEPVPEHIRDLCRGNCIVILSIAESLIHDVYLYRRFSYSPDIKKFMEDMIYEDMESMTEQLKNFLEYCYSYYEDIIPIDDIEKAINGISGPNIGRVDHHATKIRNIFIELICLTPTYDIFGRMLL